MVPGFSGFGGADVVGLIMRTRCVSCLEGVEFVVFYASL